MSIEGNDGPVSGRCVGPKNTKDVYYRNENRASDTGQDALEESTGPMGHYLGEAAFCSIILMILAHI